MSACTFCVFCYGLIQLLGVRIVFCLGKNGYHGLLAELLPVTWVCNMDMLEHGGAVYSCLQHTLAQLGFKRLKDNETDT